LVLLSKPALARQKGGDRIILELRQIVLAEQVRPAARHYQCQKFGRGRLLCETLLRGGQQVEPKEAVRLQSQQIGQFTDGRKDAAPEKLDRLAAAKLREVEFHRLWRTRQVGDAENDLVIEDTQIGDDLAVRGVEKAQGAPAKRAPRAACGDQPL